MEMDEGLILLILMAMSFVYGFFMRHMITVPVKSKPPRINHGKRNHRT